MAFPKAPQPSSVKLSPNRHQVCISQIGDYELGLSPLCGDAAYLVATSSPRNLEPRGTGARMSPRFFNKTPASVQFRCGSLPLDAPLPRILASTFVAGHGGAK